VASRGDFKRSDEDITPSDAHNTPLDIQGPVTGARARQLNLEVSSFLSTSFYDFENRLLSNDYIMIRNEGENQGIRGEDLGVGQGQQGTSKTLGGPIQLNFESTLESRRSLP
jgi:hypothetical protein